MMGVWFEEKGKNRWGRPGHCLAIARVPVLKLARPSLAPLCLSHVSFVGPRCRPSTLATVAPGAPVPVSGQATYVVRRLAG